MTNINNMKQFYKISLYINGVENNIRVSLSAKLDEIEESLQAWSTPVSERVANKVRNQIAIDHKKFIKPSEEMFLNGEEEFENMMAYRKQLDITIAATSYYNREKLFAESNIINKYLREFNND